MTHKCAADGCKREISLAYLMCRKHWAKVPRKLQKAIYRTVGDRDRTEYYFHVADAILAVQKAEGKQLDLAVGG